MAKAQLDGNGFCGLLDHGGQGAQLFQGQALARTSNADRGHDLAGDVSQGRGDTAHAQFRLFIVDGVAVLSHLGQYLEQLVFFSASAWCASDQL